MDLQERLTAFAMLGATWVMWLLVILSIFSIAVMLERGYYFWRTHDDFVGLRKVLRGKLDAGDLEGARGAMKRSPSAQAQIALAGLGSVADGHASAGTRMDEEKQLARLVMERNLAFLGTMGNNAPFVGLLGTVIGIIRAFHEMQSSGGNVSEGLMSEIGEALVATAIGLLVALPAVAAFNFFQRVIKTRATQADALGKEVLAYLESDKRKTDKPAKSKAPVKKADEDEEPEGEPAPAE
jgi:biopolymer transport protein ExbB